MKASIWSKERINEENKKIKQLFLKCYGRNIGHCKFGQLYKKNPYGTPRGVALKEGKDIVGFYGLVPQKVSKFRGGVKKSKHYLLGVSLMVSPEFRGVKGLQYIMTKTNNHLSNTNYSFILGFPNENSYLPLTKIFNWKMLVESKLHEVDVNKSMKGGEIKKGRRFAKLRDKWGFPYDDDELIEWKGRCNDYNFVSINNKLVIVYKKFKNKVDVLDAYAKSKLESAGRRLNTIVKKEGLDGLIISGYHASKIGLDLSSCNLWNENKIRLCVMGKKVEANDMHMSLLMSDVF